MKTILAHKIALNPTPSQANLLAQAVGCRRFAWNWALAEWNGLYAAGEKVNELLLRKALTTARREMFPWMSNVPACVITNSIRDLGEAYKRFFKKLGGRPHFKKKFRHDSARFDDGHPETFKSHNKTVYLPKIGWVKMRESLRFTGRVVEVTVSRTAGRWFVAIGVEIDVVPPEPKSNSVGIDFGITPAASLSSGEIFEGPKPLKKLLGKLRRLQKHLSRKKRGSNNYRKCAAKIARLHARIANIRREWIHEFTTDMTRQFGVIGIEDLNVSGMLKNHCLARAIADIGFYEMRQQLEYKAVMQGSKVVAIDRWFPSSKKCSECHHVMKELPLSVRHWTCPVCGTEHDRNVNAARNIEEEALRILAALTCSVDHTCGVESAGVAVLSRVKLLAMKQATCV